MVRVNGCPRMCPDVEAGDQMPADLARLFFLFVLFLSAGGEVGDELDELARPLSIPGIGDAVVGTDQLKRFASRRTVRFAAHGLVGAQILATARDLFRHRVEEERHRYVEDLGELKKPA